MDKNKVESIIILIVLSLIWGSSFILIKKGLLGYSADQVGALRIVIAAFVFAPYLIRNFKGINFKLYKYILVFAILEIGIPPFLYSYAQTVVNSSTAGILNSLVPLFTLLTGFIIFKVSANIFKVLGVFVGLLGAILLIFYQTGDFTSLDLTNSWGMLIVLATLMYGLGGNILKEFLQDVSDMQITSVAFVSMGIPAFLYLMTTDFISKTGSDVSVLHSLGAIAILSVIGSALAIVMFSKLVRKSNALFASFVTYLIPFVALMWGFLDGEGITLMQIFSMVMILSGIYLANLGIKRNNEKSKP
ncbi:DMT family transporter [Bacteroidota bacterium]